MISLPHLTSINCPNKAKVSHQWCWFLVNHSWFFGCNWPETTDPNLKYSMSDPIESLKDSQTFLWNCIIQSSTISIVIFYIPQNNPQSSKHPSFFLAQISKVLPPILPKTTWSHQPQWYPMNLVPISHPSLLSIVVIKHWPKAASGGKGLLQLRAS